jgi:branched-chain amino acid transport system permease protein
VPVCFAGGYLLQRGLLGRVRGADSLAPLLMTFAISIIVQNLLLESFGADGRRASGGELETMTLPVGQSINLGVLPLITLAVAVAMAFALDRLLYGTSLGARLRAVSDDPGAADLIGMSTARTCAMAMGLVGVTVAVGATFFSMSSFFAPTSGPSSLLIAFEVVVLGGLGSLWGTLIGGIVIGVAQSIGGQFDVAWQTLAGHLAFLVLFMLRPQGLFPRA